MAFVGGLLSRRKVIEVELEDTKGTDKATTRIPVFVYDAKVETAAEYIERKGSGQFLGHSRDGVIGDEVGVFSGRIELRGNGTNAMDPGVGVVLQACGFTMAAEVYSPFANTAALKTLTLDFHDDGVTKIMTGCVGTVVISGTQGNPVSAEVELYGSYGTVATEATPDVEASVNPPEIMGSGTMTFGAESLLINSFSVDMGNVVAFRSGTSLALKHYLITDRDPVISMDPEQDLVANYSYDTIRRAGTTQAFSLSLGSAAGKMITLAAPAVQIMTLGSSEREGVLTYDLTGKCNVPDLGTAGNNEFTITVKTS